MKRIVTFKEFFSTLGLGLWQACCWVFKVFNPKYKTRFWRVIWSVITLCLVLFAAIGTYLFITEEVMDKEYAYNRTWLSENVYVVCSDYSDSPKYIKNNRTGKKIAEEVEWYMVPENYDELAVYCQRTKRGYFNWKTGEVVVEPKYDKAWIFSEGLAAVCVEDTLFFIDKTGKELYRDLSLSRMINGYEPDYLFHNGLCLVGNRNGNVGLLKTDGTWALPIAYNEIEHHEELGLWQVEKDGHKALVDNNMNEVFGGDFSLLEVMDEDHIYVMPKDGGVKQRYNLKGELLDACVIWSTSQLTYSTDKLERINGEDDIYETVAVEDVATCLYYSIGSGYCGLMSKSGKIITPAIYSDINAIGKDLYCCDYDDDHSVLLNSRGEKVNP